MTGRFDPDQMERLLEPAGDDLDEARAFMRLLLSDSPAAIVVAHVERDPVPRFRMDYVSANSAELFGEPADRFVAHFDEWAERLDGDARAALTRQYLQLVAGERDELQLTVGVDLPDGRPRTLGVTMRHEPATDQLVGHVYDASGYRAADALEDNQHLLDGVVRGSPDIFAVLDDAGLLSFVNPATKDVLGYEMYEVIGRPPSAFVHPDDQDALVALVDQSRRIGGGATSARVRGRHRDGHWVPLDIRARPLLDGDGGSSGIVAIARDASPHLVLEQRLREAKEAAERASRAKDEFLSRMSHELRTPLNAVLGFAQLLEMAELGWDDRESVAQIRDAGDHLLQLIDEVLDIARIEAGKLTVSLEAVSAAVAAADAVDLVAPLARQRRIGLVVSDLAGVWVQADRQRLVQVLINLLSNAIKFNHPGGRVQVTADPDADDGYCHLTVVDTGPGIDPAQLDRIFEPFEPLDPDRQASGTGIGLALSRALTNQMGGRLLARSTPGSGTTFELVLPVAPTPSLLIDFGDLTVSPRPSDLGPLRILAIEDNATNHDLIARALDQHAADDRLVAASQGSLGVALAQADPPDVILLDLHLPDMTGDEVLAALRAMPETASTPVVVLSADATSGIITKMMSAGADHYVAKPVVLRDLLAVLDRYRPRTDGT